jgi:hypothetical protein
MFSDAGIEGSPGMRIILPKKLITNKLYIIKKKNRGTTKK